jgi:hypothetical protein
METRVVEMEYRFQRQLDSQQLLINELRHEVRPPAQILLPQRHLLRRPTSLTTTARCFAAPTVVGCRSLLQVEEGKHRMAEMLRVTTTLPQRVKELESSVSAKASETEVRTASLPSAASPVEPKLRPGQYGPWPAR